MAKGQKTGGRKKGSRNKTTVVAKEAIALAAERLGGVDRLTAWTQENAENEKAFWVSIFPKLLPLQVSGDPDNPIRQVHTVERRIVRPSDPNSGGV